MAEIGYGAKLFSGTLSGETYTWTEILNVKSIQPANPEVEKVDVTHLQSDDKIKEYIPGLIEPGTLEFEVYYTEAGYTALVALRGASAKHWKVEMQATSPDTFIFGGFLTKVEIASFEAGAAKMVKGSVQVSGPITVS